MHVLIVDDYPDTAETACQLLESAGHECRAVTCGADALAAVDAFRPDLAIIDIDLPDMDGCALLGALRSRFPTHPPYLVALTGSKHALERAVEAGFDECLLKPAGREQLLRVAQLAQRRRATS